MARSPELLLVLAVALVGDARDPAPAHAAPTAEQKAARKQARKQKAAARHGDPAAPTAGPPAGEPTRPPTAAGEPTRPPALPPCPPDNTLTRRSFGAGFLLTWCTGCHSSSLPADARQDAPEGVNFDTHAAYKLSERLVYERAVLEAHAFVRDPSAASPMPPAGLPPAADRERLAQWIACGSPLP